MLTGSSIEFQAFNLCFSCLYITFYCQIKSRPNLLLSHPPALDLLHVFFLTGSILHITQFGGLFSELFL